MSAIARRYGRIAACSVVAGVFAGAVSMTTGTVSACFAGAVAGLVIAWRMQ